MIPIDAYTSDDAERRKKLAAGIPAVGGFKPPTYGAPGTTQSAGTPAPMQPSSAKPLTETVQNMGAPQPTPSTAPPLPGTTTQPFGPQGDLRSTQINPTGFNRPAAIGQYAGQFSGLLNPGSVGYKPVGTNVNAPGYDPSVAFQGVNTTLNAGPAVNPTDSAALTKFRDYQSGAADKLANGPSRAQIAKDQLDAFDLQSQPQIRDQIRAVGQSAAKFGRLGMGDTAVETLRPYTDYLTNRAAMAKQLSAETAQGEISDRLANVGQFSNLVGQEAGIGASQRNELRGERDYSTQVADTNIGRGISERDKALGLAEANKNREIGQVNDATGLAERNLNRAANERDTQLGVDTGNVSRAYDASRSALDAALGQTGAQSADEANQRNEVRGERSYQDQIAQQALANALSQHQQENSDYQDEFGRNYALAGLGLGGAGASPFLGAAGQAAASGAQGVGGAADLLAQYYARQKAQKEAA